MTTSQDEQTPWLFVWVGIVALAIAMGIGRFAFTPLLPLMLRDGTIDTPPAPNGRQRITAVT
jgi:hypothetical protein